MTAFFLEYVNLFIQGFAFFVSLLVLATGVLNFSFGSLVTVAALETFGIFILLFGVSSTSVSLKMTSEPYIQRGIADLSAATSDVVLTTANRLHEANPAKQQFTLKEIVQALEPVPRDVVLARLALGLSVEELLSNTLLQLGRDGNLTVDLVPDSRGCAHLVVGFSSSMPDPLDANYRRARRPDDLGS
jgi:hypothetical protein